jgi:hypothetical protein
LLISLAITRRWTPLYTSLCCAVGLISNNVLSLLGFFTEPAGVSHQLIVAFSLQFFWDLSASFLPLR